MSDNDNKADPEQPAKTYYSEPGVIKGYTSVGLYPAEEIIVAKFFKQKDTLLDIGCGTGRTSIPLARQGHKVTGIDIVPEMIEIAGRQAKDYNIDVVFEVMNAAKMTFPHESFQYVLFSFNGFDHLLGRTNRERFLRDVFNILKTGGCFILTARSGVAFGRRWLAWIWMLLTHLWQKHKWGQDYELGDKRFGNMHLHYTSPFRMRLLLKALGFDIQYFNSEKHIVHEKPASFLTNFSNDRMLFYVLRKQQ